MSAGRASALLQVAAWLVFAASAHAQTDLAVRGFADVGSVSFAAERTFEAVLGGRSGPVFGGGVEVLLPENLFVDFRASRFRRTGQRVFVYNNESFPLGIPVTVSITPLELVGGYRFVTRSRVTPYAGAGIGWHRYEETSEFADANENVHEWFTGFHVLGGAEVRLARWIGAGGDVDWATVPDALGQHATGASRELQESNLGGFTLRARVVIGR